MRLGSKVRARRPAVLIPPIPSLSERDNRDSSPGSGPRLARTEQTTRVGRGRRQSALSELRWSVEGWEELARSVDGTE
ncbi:hypothetical protein FJT64_024937 [Amphibalanus amphitrite]|uniref:Uncharacterized protein n=1 Tax=Amphibalanus amphitrite TaxID=1232801 RepID=A0A6A4W6T4_AMPAM|nr:hypothetical protein FJT64_024937 [Amphibalanus amphitrite]